ncbi:hypothetical protein BC940DRAFT_312041 [Gongronella butleri]|nr:hypothetical protein BC940DRAFT_312041 [Gongronella butleri]
MEDNKTPDIATPCTAGCGFYGNKIYNNMCSKCFKDSADREKAQEAAVEAAESAAATPATSVPTVEEKVVMPASTPAPTEPTQHQDKHWEEQKTQDDQSSTAPTPAAPSLDAAKDENNDDKPVQKNKGRCFMCRVKIPLAKQLTNKCRCDYVFCDSHRYPDKHECQFDHASMDKDILAKNNPKLNDRPRGGRSFQRLDSL